MILEHIKEMSGTYAEGKVRDCVITVPLFFTQFERQALERRASAMRKLAWEKAGRPKPPPGVTPPDARRPSMRDPAWSENPAAHPGYPTLVSERRLSYDAVEGYSEEMAEERLS